MAFELSFLVDIMTQQNLFFFITMSQPKTKINHECLKNILLFLDFSKRSEQQSNSIL